MTNRVTELQRCLLLRQLKDVGARINIRLTAWPTLSFAQRQGSAIDGDLNRLIPDLLRDPSLVDRVPQEHLGGLAAVLSSMTTALLAKAVSLKDGMVQSGSDGTDQAPDRLLTAEQAAALLNVTPRWLYRRSHRLPFTRRLSRRAVRFSETGLQRWLAKQNAAK
jgi:excisionase family DNA binding protein